MKPATKVGLIRLIGMISALPVLGASYWLAINYGYDLELVVCIAAVTWIAALYIFSLLLRVTCPKCGGTMEICEGDDKIIYECRKCGQKIDSGYHSEY